MILDRKLKHICNTAQIIGPLLNGFLSFPLIPFVGVVPLFCFLKVKPSEIKVMNKNPRIVTTHPKVSFRSYDIGKKFGSNKSPKKMKNATSAL
jgi:hypothetical protein